MNIKVVDFDKLANLYDSLTSTETSCDENERKYNNIDTCENCHSQNITIDHITGTVVCIECGVVFNEILDCNVLMVHDSDGNSSVIGSTPINSLLPQSSLGANSVFGLRGHLKRHHHWLQMPYKERSLNKEYKHINEACLRGHLSKSIEDDAKSLFKISSECVHMEGINKGKAKITRGANRQSIVASCIFFACIRKGLVKTAKEIVELYNEVLKVLHTKEDVQPSQISINDLNKGTKLLYKSLEEKGVELNMTYIKPEYFIIEHCNKLSLKREYQELAYQIAMNVDKLDMLYSHTSYSIAATCILLTAELFNLNITKQVLAKEFGIAEATIVKVHKKIKPYLNILLNNHLVERLSKIYRDVRYMLDLDIIIRMIMFDVSIDDIGKNYREYYQKQKDIDMKRFEMNNLLDEMDNMNITNFDTKILVKIHNKINELDSMV